MYLVHSKMTNLRCPSDPDDDRRRRVVVAMFLHCICTRTVYWRILKFFKQAGEYCIFLNGSFYELANPLCLWISGTEIVWLMCIFLCLLVRNVVCTLVSIADSRVQVSAIRVYLPWCLVLKSVQICFLWNFDHAWDHTIKTELFTRI